MYFVFTKNFQNLHESHDLHSGEDLDGSVDLLLCEPPFIIRFQQFLHNSDCDVFYTKETDSFCVSADYVLKRGGHGHIFSSAV